MSNRNLYGARLNLIDWASEYLEADGYAVNRRGRSLVVGNRPTLGEESEFVYVWVADAASLKSFASKEGPMLDSFAEVASSHPRSTRFFLVASTEGMSANFRRRALEHDVRVRVPGQFFDTEFKWERSPETASATRELMTRGEERARKRVDQPYELRGGSGGDDALAPLLAAFGAPRRPIQIVIGPAGAGKSVLFETVLSELFRHFLAQKQSQLMGCRPLPLSPASVMASRERSVGGLLDSLLESYFARPLNREVFEWMMSHRQASWLIDGLDEVIADDPNFFEYLADLITRPGEFPVIGLFVRDALTATNDAFRQFLDEYGSQCSVYRLAPWGEDQKRQFARLTLPGASSEFLGRLRKRAGLNSLASSPFYCTLLADLFSADQLADEYSEQDLLAHAVSSILDREYEKHILEPHVMPKSEMESFCEVVAAQDFEHGFQGVPVATALEWASIAVPEEVPESDRGSLALRLTQTALFSASEGRIRFAQDVLEHFLLGRYLLSSFQRDSGVLVTKLSLRRIPPDWITLRIVADGVRENREHERAKGVLQSAVGRSPTFANAVQLANLVPLEFSSVPGFSFENEDLTGVEFIRVDLRDMSFRNSDLTDTTFDNCKMNGAVLEDAILRNTGFLNMVTGSLTGATVGELRRFFSIRVDAGHRMGSHADAAKWFAKRVGSPVSAVEPCASALQLRFLFMKFVAPDGTARRSWLDRSGVLRGRRLVDPEHVLEASIRYGYLVSEYRDRIARPGGDKYSEMIRYVTGLTLTPGLREVLADVCDVTGCLHIPELT